MLKYYAKYMNLTKADSSKWSKICNQENMKGKTKMMSFSQMVSRVRKDSHWFTFAKSLPFDFLISFH